jgi:dolichol-phosphate mannosyltransferase
MGESGAELHAPTLSVVIPCYDEADNIDELCRRVTAVCRDITRDSYEIVLVNDGSRDDTWHAMTRRGADDPHLVCVNLSRNHGHQLALSAGLHVCRGQRILILDADLQDPPELLPAMMERMDAGCDVVYGKRTSRQGESWFKKVTAAGFYRALDRLVDISIPVDTGDFRLMSRRALDVLNRMPEQHRFLRGMVSWVGFRQEPVLYERAPRFAGTTKYPLTRMMKLAIDAVTGFSVRPLRLASYLGLVSGPAGLLLLGCVFFSWLRGDVVRGWASVCAVVLVMGSAQLVVAGVLGEYLGRLYMESKRRPLFVIQDIHRHDEPRTSTVHGLEERAHQEAVGA